ncbi:MAG: demethylmenaquinone methyltransferase / 2-methoxy-6-polyprenyl,4-benzoquinol methylase [Verrucomicrobiota bacterium]|jgi:demethylmenaquinone methyltransferase/2-methoxy-6-polyprenyl-1,4-benzoquinol methylase
MSNAYYDPGDQRAERVNALFSRIASRYDFINDLQSLGLHRLWKRRVVELACPLPGERALDLCCGTGDITFAMARRGADVVGLDFNESMLSIAARRAKDFKTAPSVRGPEFIRGDALQLPFPDHSFDVVTVGYGLRNLAAWEMGLREMIRVAKPGGRLVILDFGKPANPVWRAIYFTYLRLCVPVFGWIFCRDAAAYAYILESLHSFPAQRGIDQKLRELGCHSTRLLEPLGGVMGLNTGISPLK